MQLAVDMSGMGMQTHGYCHSTSYYCHSTWFYFMVSVMVLPIPLVSTAMGTSFYTDSTAHSAQWSGVEWSGVECSVVWCGVV